MKRLFKYTLEKYRSYLMYRILSIADKLKNTEKDEKILQKLTGRLKVVNLKLGIIK